MYTGSIHRRTTIDPKKPEQKPSKQPPRQNLENKETTKRLPAKEAKQHPQGQYVPLRPIGLVTPIPRRSFDVSVSYGTLQISKLLTLAFLALNHLASNLPMLLSLFFSHQRIHLEDLPPELCLDSPTILLPILIANSRLILL